MQSFDKSKLRQFSQDLEKTLLDAEAIMGRPVKGRFRKYQKVIAEAAEFAYPRPFPWDAADVRRMLFFEGASQAQQLVDSSVIWDGTERALLGQKLSLVFDGDDLPKKEDVDGAKKSDTPRNTLVELTTASILRRKGLAAKLTSGEDVRAVAPGLPPFIVECKRPASRNSLQKNLNGLRHQLRDRRQSFESHGMAVVVADRLLGLAGLDALLPDAATLERILVKDVRVLIDEIRRHAAAGHGNLWPHAEVGAILIVGAVFLRNPGFLVTFSQMGLFFTGDEGHPRSRTILRVLRPLIEGPS